MFGLLLKSFEDSDLHAHYFFVCGCIPAVYIYINN